MDSWEHEQNLILLSQFRLQNYQNNLSCHAVCQLDDGMTAFFLGLIFTIRTYACSNKEKSLIIDLAVIARRLPVGGCRSNLIQAQKMKRLLRFVRNDSVT